MQLSVVIVNYNVKYFIEQALYSVERAIEGMDAEVIVVDNASGDGSTDLIKARFPGVRLICNDKNTGFAVANNQAIALAKGKYVLLLNPDTVLPENALKKCCEYMEQHSDVGALGVKMLDGQGQFLPESKRALPTPLVSFYKIFGLAELFPHSKRFARYHLGYLDKDENHEVDVLAGAFMFIRKAALDKSGLFDEAFFMYGEDIDLSYRIQQSGFKLMYLSEVEILHYKGESTKRGSLNYVRIFYNAMIIFAEKHFSGKRAQLYSRMIHFAVYLRAGMSLMRRFLAKLLLPLSDALLILAGLHLSMDFWAETVKHDPNYYENNVSGVLSLVYTFIWLISLYFNGAYDRPFRFFRLVRGVFIGTIFIAVLYAFLEENFRFSRALILLGSIWAIFSTTALRSIWNFFSKRSFAFDTERSNRLAIVGGLKEGKRALSLLSQAGVDYRFIGYILPEKMQEQNSHVLGSFENIETLCNWYEIEELIFCNADIEFKDIVHCMQSLGGKVQFKTITPGSNSIIGSNSKKSAGDLYAIDFNLAIDRPMQRRNKRVMDLILAFIMLIAFPLLLFWVKNSLQLLKNIIGVIVGKVSWVGYEKGEFDYGNFTLPKVKPGVLYPSSVFSKIPDNNTKARLNLLYAKDYSVYSDLRILGKALMGRVM
ncbi:MAG: glycosyltransferase [Chitinophagales bacterium]